MARYNKHGYYYWHYPSSWFNSNATVRKLGLFPASGKKGPVIETSSFKRAQLDKNILVPFFVSENGSGSNAHNNSHVYFYLPMYFVYSLPLIKHMLLKQPVYWRLYNNKCSLAFIILSCLLVPRCALHFSLCLRFIDAPLICIYRFYLFVYLCVHVLCWSIVLCTFYTILQVRKICCVDYWKCLQGTNKICIVKPTNWDSKTWDV